jgi:hypothetical protein
MLGPLGVAREEAGRGPRSFIQDAQTRAVVSTRNHCWCQGDFAPAMRTAAQRELPSGMILLNEGWQFLPKPFMARMLNTRTSHILMGSPSGASHDNFTVSVEEPDAFDGDKPPRRRLT